MADDILTLVVAAKDNASATMARVSREVRALGPAAGKAAGPLGVLSTVTGGLVSPMTLALGATAALGAGAIATVSAASDLNEEIQKAGVVFGKSAGSVRTFAENAVTIGLSERAALGAAGALGNMFNSTGLAEDASAKMSITMVQLAADMASFNNESPEEMLLRLRSGLAGEAEPLRRFGVLINEAAVKTFAYANGIAAAGSELNDAQKVQARYGLILEKTADQQGDVERSGDTLAAAQREIGASLENLAAQIGNEFLPAAAAFTSWIANDAMPALSELVDALRQVGAAMGWLGEQADTIDQAFRDVHGTILETSQIELDPGKWWNLHDWVVEQIDSSKDEITSFHPGDALGIMWGEVPQRIAAQEARIYAATHKVLHDPVEQAAVDARKAAQIEFAKLPRDIAEAVKDNLPDINDGLDALKDMFKTSLSDTEKIARLEGILSSKALAKGLRDERFDVRAAAKEVQQNARDELRELKTGAKDAAADGGKTYAQFLKSWRNEAGDAGKQLSDAALLELQIDGRAMHAGYSGGQSFVAGIVSSLIEGIPTVNNAAYRFMAGTLGTSLPKSGPFAHPEKGAYSIADKFREALSERLGSGGIGAQSMPVLGMGVGGAAGYAGARSAGGSGLTVIFQSTFPATPGQQAAVAEAIGPELERWRRRQGR